MYHQDYEQQAYYSGQQYHPETNDSATAFQSDRSRQQSTQYYPDQGYYYPGYSVAHEETQSPMQGELPQRNHMIVHAPMPMLGQNPLLSRNFEDLSSFQASYPGLSRQSSYFDDTIGSQSQISWPASGPEHKQSDPGVTTFPTPSELLVELSSRDDHLADSVAPLDYAYLEHSATQIDVAQPSVTSSGSADPPPTPSSFGDQHESGDDKKPEINRGRARRRVLSQSQTGITTTDPDTISSHEKKRHYLECLEQYVMYLHQQLEMADIPPLPLRRVESYTRGGKDGLSSRSIRTLLVHMGNQNCALNTKIAAEEQRFLALREEVLSKGFASPGSESI